MRAKTENSFALPSTYNEIRITGVKKTDHQLLSEIFSTASSASSLSKLQESIQISLQRLLSMDIIKDASISIVPNQKGAWNVEIGLQERKFKINAGTHVAPGTNSLAFGTSAVFFNLFGRGESFSLESSVADAQGKVSPISLAFRKPLIEGGTVSVELYQNSLGSTLGSFTACPVAHKIIGFWPKVRRIWEMNSIGGKGSFSLEVGYHACLKQIIDQKENSYWTSGISILAQCSTLDNTLLPSKGTLLKAAIDAMGIGGDYSFLKGSIYAKGHHALGPLIFGASTRIGGIFSSFSSLPILEQFHMGGPGSVRGYPAFGCGNGHFLYEGGFSLGFPLREWLMPHLFLNAGTVGQKEPFNRWWWSFGAGTAASIFGGGRLEVNFVLPIYKGFNNLRFKDCFQVGFSMEPL